MKHYLTFVVNKSEKVLILSELAKLNVIAEAKRENGITNIYVEYNNSQDMANALYVVKKLGF